MKQRLKNQRGTTLVELIVCMVLLSLFTLAAVTLIQPQCAGVLGHPAADARAKSGRRAH